MQMGDNNFKSIPLQAISIVKNWTQHGKLHKIKIRKIKWFLLLTVNDKARFYMISVHS